MSQFFDQASLVMVPSGYKNGKVYSQKPLSTDGELTFSRASTATRVNASGIIEEVASGVPRLDYSGGASCPSLLLEPQTTALNPKSEDINGWQSAGGTSSANTTETLDPSGYYGADIMNESCVRYWATSLSSATYTLSCFAKAKTGTNFILRIDTPSSISATFNLSTGAISGVSAGVTAKIEDYGNGWKRCAITFTQPIINYVLTTEPSSQCYVWGANLTQTSYLQSYIPTLSTAVTRVGEAAFKTGISSLIGQTEGTLYAEIVRTQSSSGDAFWININDNSANNWIFIGTEATAGRFYVRASNSVIVDQYPAISLGTHKLALAYKSGSIVGYVDGVQIFTSSSTFTIGSLTGVNIGASSPTLATLVNTAGAVKQTLLFPTRLSNADLATLTTI